MNTFLWISHINVIEVFNNSIILTGLKWKITHPLGSNIWPFNLQAPDSFWASRLFTQLLSTSLQPWHNSFQKSGLQVFVELHWISRIKTALCLRVPVHACVSVSSFWHWVNVFSKFVAVDDTGAGELAHPQSRDLCSHFPFPQGL